MLVSSCGSATEVLNSDFSLATGAYPDTIILCASHTASRCGAPNNLLIPIVVTRKNYNGDIALSLMPAPMPSYFVPSLQPLVPGPDNGVYSPNGWDGTGYVPDHAKLIVYAFTFGVVYSDSIFGRKSFVISGRGPDGTVRTTNVTFVLSQ